MPVTPTYPGVYIEELPSATHTIIGVATSITAFVGFTKQGPVNTATQVLSYGDFSRAFGDLDPDCPLTYAVQQFFLNGGSEAYIVRVAEGAAQAGFNLVNDTSATGVVVLLLQAATAGAWGNTLQVTIDRNTLNPASLFNLSVTQYVMSGGSLVPGRSESFRNLTMNSVAPAYAVDTINFNSQLLSATRGAVPYAPTALPAPAATGSSTSGSLTAPVVIGATTNSIAMSLNGRAAGHAHDRAGQLHARAAQERDPQRGNRRRSGDQRLGERFERAVQRSHGDRHRAVVAALHPCAHQRRERRLDAGRRRGGLEVDAIAAFHPLPTGTTGNDIDASLAAAATTLQALSQTVHSVSVTITTGGGAGGGHGAADRRQHHRRDARGPALAPAVAAADGRARQPLDRRRAGRGDGRRSSTTASS